MSSTEDSAADTGQGEGVPHVSYFLTDCDFFFVLG